MKCTMKCRDPITPVNHKLLPIKLYYFFFYAGYSALFPYLPHYLSQQGWTTMDNTLILGAVPFAIMFTRPLISHYADKLSKHKICIIVSLIFAILFYCLVLIVPSPVDFLSCSISNNSFLSLDSSQLNSSANNSTVDSLKLEDVSTEHNNSSALPSSPYDDDDLRPRVVSRWTHFHTWQYWTLFLMILFGTAVCLNPTTSMVDAICLCILTKDNSHLFGRQRIWMTVGFGGSLIVTAVIIDEVSEDSTKFVDYLPSFVTFAVMVFGALVTTLFIKVPPEMLVNVKQSATRQQNTRRLSADSAKQRKYGMQRVFPLLKNVKVCLFLLCNLISGLNAGMSLFTGIIFLKQLGAKQIVLGIGGFLVCISTAVGFVISGRLTKKVGHHGTQILVLSMYSVRAGLFSLIHNPWITLALNPLFGLSLALALTSTGSYAAKHARKGAQSSVQAFFTAIGEGIGVALGNVVSGAVIHRYGTRVSWKVFSGISAVAAVAALISLLSIRKFKSNSSQRHYELSSQNAEHAEITRPNQ